MAAVFAVLFFVEYNREQPTDWSNSFSRDDKIPYGNLVLFQLLPEYFPGQEIEVVNRSITEKLASNYELQKAEENEVNPKLNVLATQDSAVDEATMPIEKYTENTMRYREDAEKANYIFVNTSFDFNEIETKYLLDFVRNGSDVLIASDYLSQEIMDSLWIYINYHGYEMLDTSYGIRFCSSTLKDTGLLKMRNRGFNSYVDSIKNDSCYILAYDDRDYPTFVRFKIGNGSLMLLMNPYLLTNFAALDTEAQTAVAGVLSYLPQRKIYWDEHYKVKKLVKDSPLRYILNSESLRWAYYITTCGLLLYLFFMGKRRQRIIPILDPMKNSSLEFAETVGQLYFQKQDHRDLAEKKIRYFFDYLRQQYRMHPTHEMQEDEAAFYKRLADKSGVPLAQIQSLFHQIKYTETFETVSAQQLMELNNRIENFKLQKK